ncbi:MAG: bifunctional 2-methylcitrate dehydratase/aconitate hydratase [Candidatus Hodarchaeales archaeon]|jgi:2-methylcitrate dehydratase
MSNQIDKEMVDIAKYVLEYLPDSDEAYNTARLCLMDSIGSAVLALRFPECAKMIGPVVPGTAVPNGARIPGTTYELDPITAAFNIGVLIRWLDYNDTWLAAEWGHPSDNLGAILGLGDYLSRKNIANGLEPLTMRDIFTWMIKAYEIQGCMALENSFNQRGIDHVILVKLASAAIAAGMLGCNERQVINTISQVWCDVGPLRTYRHAPNTGSRKSWAAGDATSRGVFLAFQSLRGEMGYNTCLSAPKWGFYDRIWNGNRFKFQLPYENYVIENILFKVGYPAEFHGQSAVEAAINLHSKVVDKLEEIKQIEIITHEAAVRIIDKRGPLHNPADRDHCLQYMVAIGLMKGSVVYEDYEEESAVNPQIDILREKMDVKEEPQFTKDYHDPDKRSISNSIQVFFNDGTNTEKITIEYPVGHRRRRSEAIPLLEEKFINNISSRYPSKKVEDLVTLFKEQERLEQMPVHLFMEFLQA